MRKDAYTPAWRFRNPEENWFRAMSKGYTLNLCAGRSQLGDVRVDLYEFADIRADARYPPFRKYSFDTIIFDPPFSWYANLSQTYRLIKELATIAKQRMIIVGLWQFAPMLRGWTFAFYWRRAWRGTWLRWVAILTRNNEVIDS